MRSMIRRQEHEPASCEMPLGNLNHDFIHTPHVLQKDKLDDISYLWRSWNNKSKNQNKHSMFYITYSLDIILESFSWDKWSVSKTRVFIQLIFLYEKNHAFWVCMFWEDIWSHRSPSEGIILEGWGILRGSKGIKYSRNRCSIKWCCRTILAKWLLISSQSFQHLQDGPQPVINEIITPI